MWRCEAAQRKDGRAGEREELDLCPEEAGLAAGFPQGSSAAAATQEEADAGSLPGTAVGSGGKRERTAQFTQELCSNMWLEENKPRSQSKQGEDLECLLLQSWAGWGFHVLLSRQCRAGGSK